MTESLVQETLQVGAVLSERRQGTPNALTPQLKPSCLQGRREGKESPKGSHGSHRSLQFALHVRPSGVTLLATGNTRAGDVLSLG